MSVNLNGYTGLEYKEKINENFFLLIFTLKVRKKLLHNTWAGTGSLSLKSGSHLSLKHTKGPVRRRELHSSEERKVGLPLFAWL